MKTITTQFSALAAVAVSVNLLHGVSGLTSIARASFVSMGEQYEEYLRSEEWSNKRQQRLVLAGKRCEVCGTNKPPIHVHHLTYARIFNEEMTDLLPLCERHHEEIEKMIREGKLGRDGNTTELALQTVRLLLENDYKAEAKPRKTLEKKGNGKKGKTTWIQEELRSMPEFVALRGLNRKQFKEAARALFLRRPHFSAYMANAFAIYDYKKW